MLGSPEPLGSPFLCTPWGTFVRPFQSPNRVTHLFGAQRGFRARPVFFMATGGTKEQGCCLLTPPTHTPATTATLRLGPGVR